MTKYILGLGIVLAAVISCRKDNNLPYKVKQTSVQDSLSLASVQSWYQQQSSSKSLNATSPSVNIARATHFNISKLNFDWGKAGNIHDTKRG